MQRYWWKVLCGVCLAGTVYCAEAPKTDGTDPITPRDTSRADTTVGTQLTVTSSGWANDGGPVLLVPTQRIDAATVIYPHVQGEHTAADLEFDTTIVRQHLVRLVSRDGAVVNATIGERTSPAEDEDCTGWPMYRLQLRHGMTSMPVWHVGFVGNSRLQPVLLDSIGSLTQHDSAALVAEVSRLASTIPTSGRTQELRGLPFVVRDVRRFSIRSEREVLIARVVRGVHREANPIEERTLLIAERDSVGKGRYRLAFQERAVGAEETIEGTEILGVLTIADTAARPLVFLARESDSGVRYSTLMRKITGVWEASWTSALLRC